MMTWAFIILIVLLLVGGYGALRGLDRSGRHKAGVDKESTTTEYDRAEEDAAADRDSQGEKESREADPKNRDQG